MLGITARVRQPQQGHREILGLGLETIRGYRKTLMRKLGVRNVAGLTQIAVASGVALPNALVELRRTRTVRLASREGTSVLRGFSGPP